MQLVQSKPIRPRPQGATLEGESESPAIGEGQTELASTIASQLKLGHQRQDPAGDAQARSTAVHRIERQGGMAAAQRQVAPLSLPQAQPVHAQHRRARLVFQA